jgi:hypothetical protein
MSHSKEQIEAALDVWYEGLPWREYDGVAARDMAMACMAAALEAAAVPHAAPDESDLLVQALEKLGAAQARVAELEAAGVHCAPDPDVLMRAQQRLLGAAQARVAELEAERDATATALDAAQQHWIAEYGSLRDELERLRAALAAAVALEIGDLDVERFWRSIAASIQLPDGEFRCELRRALEAFLAARAARAAAASVPAVPAPVQPGDYSDEQVGRFNEAYSKSNFVRTAYPVLVQDAIRIGLAAASVPPAPVPETVSINGGAPMSWREYSEHQRTEYLRLREHDLDTIKALTQRCHRAESKQSVPAAPSDGRVLEWSESDYDAAGIAVTERDSNVPRRMAKAALDAVQPKLRAAFDAGWSEGRVLVEPLSERETVADVLSEMRLVTESDCCDSRVQWADRIEAALSETGEQP